ncbi:MAG: uroporphyrinogen-III C-methyltransferase [Leptospiraceae bacterium]|nr:uroporphyrinogen-III C-methyltransferase [Leptospiraceae bacterium]
MNIPINIPFEANTVYLVGAGSGDPKYLTLEAYSILLQAEIILYDTNLKSLCDLFPQAISETVGKRKGFHEKKQNEINDLLVEYAKQGKRVVRLKGGDVSFFARASEEISILQENGFKVKLVMGISSPQLLAGALGESLTHRDLTRSISFYSGYRDKSIPRVDLPNTDAHIIFMGLGDLEEIVVMLLNSGKSPETSFIAASNLGRTNQRILKTTLGNAIEEVKAANLESPTLLAIGLGHIIE